MPKGSKGKKQGEKFGINKIRNARVSDQDTRRRITNLDGPAEAAAAGQRNRGVDNATRAADAAIKKNGMSNKEIERAARNAKGNDLTSIANSVRKAGEVKGASTKAVRNRSEAARKAAATRRRRGGARGG